MKSSIFSYSLLISLILVLQPACAGNYKRHDFYDQARVIKVKPIHETVEIHRPVEECWQEEIVYHPQYGHGGNNNVGGIIAGGIIGGVAGHQIGGGRGKDIATVAGTLIGALIGDNLSNRQTPRYNRHKKYISHETHCDTINTISSHEEIVGYRVKYRYKGHFYWTRTVNHPGKYIDVKVNVQPRHRS
ncbi:MAG: glycine zipper 2TM domain-containing protein [Pseudomonadota bacterium]